MANLYFKKDGVIAKNLVLVRTEYVGITMEHVKGLMLGANSEVMRSYSIPSVSLNDNKNSSIKVSDDDELFRIIYTESDLKLANSIFIHCDERKNIYDNAYQKELFMEIAKIKIVDIDRITECSCESLSLFRFGCKCGFSKKEK